MRDLKTENTDRSCDAVSLIIETLAGGVGDPARLSLSGLGSWSEIPPVAAAAGIVVFLSGLVNVYSASFNFGTI